MLINQNPNYNKSQLSFKALKFPKTNFENITGILNQNGYKDTGTQKFMTMLPINPEKDFFTKVICQMMREGLSEEHEFGIIEPPGVDLLLIAKTNVETKIKDILNSKGIVDIKHILNL